MYTQDQIDKLQKYVNEFVELEQDLFNNVGGALLGEDIKMDLVRISGICRALYMRIRMIEDETFGEATQ